jgi:hypothetical protein
MFEAFYGLSHAPFSRDIPTTEVYRSSVLEETLGRLPYAAERQWFAVSVRSLHREDHHHPLLLETLDQARIKLLYLADSKLTPRHFSKGCSSNWVARPSSTAVTPNDNCTGDRTDEGHPSSAAGGGH